MAAFFLLFLCLLGLGEGVLLKVEDGGPGTDHLSWWLCGSAQIPGQTTHFQSRSLPVAVRRLPPYPPMLVLANGLDVLTGEA